MGRWSCEIGERQGTPGLLKGRRAHFDRGLADSSIQTCELWQKESAVANQQLTGIGYSSPMQLISSRCTSK